MKKALYLLLFFTLLFSTACSNEAEKTSPQNEKIKDIDAIINFVKTTDTNLMTDRNDEKLVILENYETHYFDFTGEGNDDIAIVTWSDDNEYLPVIFVTTDIIENEYYLLNSDFRASSGDKFFYEDDFIIKEDSSNKLYDFAYKLGDEYIQMVQRYIPYGDVTETIQPLINTKSILHHTLNKIDGFKNFNVKMISSYYDENGKEHNYENITYSYTFNEDTLEFERKETKNVESIPIENVITDNFIVGNDYSLNTFESIYNENDMETAVNYYINNRQNFNKETRLNYLDNFFDKLNAFLYNENYNGNNNLVALDEIITDNNISSVTILSEEIPEKMKSTFSIVKSFYVEDGANPPTHIDEYGSYYITCIKSDITNKIKLMSYDREILKNELGEYNYSGIFDNFVVVEFENQQQMLEGVETIVYPTVLIDDLSQLEAFKHKDIWKTNIVIEPKEIIFNNIDEIYGFEDI